MNRRFSYRNKAVKLAATFAIIGTGCWLNSSLLLGAPTITYVQGNYATPQTPQSTVNITFTAAQAAGNLNVVVVGWNDSTATVTGLTDKSGNVYARAVGPTVISGSLSQSIYYAKNIVAATAGTNIVTVTFSVAAAYPDVRILEYSGADPANPVDVTAASSGNSATSSSGAATTTNATDLIFGANIVTTTTSGPGSGFTSRLITSLDGDIAEDEMVTVTGSYSATAPLSSGQWIMQMVAFRTPSGTPPTVSSVSPNSGPAIGGTSVTITGTNFVAGDTVTLGGAAATNVVVVNSTTITATTPAGAGVVTVTVTNPGGLSGSLAGGFTYIVPPTVSSVTPNNGALAGGTAVTITGTNFTAGATVTFGSAAATNVVVVNSTTITATTPAGSAGAVTVTVTNGTGLIGSLANAFTYLAPPTVSSVSPNSGSTAGGTSVTITGANFAAGATVTFGGAAATSVVVVNGTSITAKTPAGSAGAVTVTVTVSGQSGSLASGFTYVVAPTVTSVSPNNGPTAGGTPVTITGANFAAGATVMFGATAATNVAVVNSTTITATTPAASTGAVTVTVTVNSQSGSLTNGFTYIAQPTVTSVSPSSGTTAGGTAVTITGTNFVAGATATFSGTAATNVVVVNSTTITATTPAGSAGTVTVTVSVSGQSGSLASGFTYVVVPTVTSVSPNNGPVAGGTAVTITGANLASGAAVTFGSAAATNVAVVNSTTITATTPAGSAGAVTVTVTVNSQSGSLANGFTYIAPPTVTAINPNTGTTAGGTAVTITGTNFATGATVTFGGTAATNVAVVNSATITATTPAGSAGAVTVTVTNPGSLSGSLTNGYTYVVGPTVTSVSPNNGPTAGGTAVTITGTNFAAGATVTLGGTAATNVVVVNSTTIAATTPARSAGAVTVTVTVNSQSGSLTNGFTYNGAVTITLVQGNSAVPQSSQTTVNVTFTAAQAAGDLNVVVAGWSNTTSTVSAVTDNHGNTYTLAVGPTVQAGIASQSIYYAKNIAAAAVGTNTVTVTFSAAAAYPDIRILEYSGADPNNPVDVTAAGSGNSTISSSGAATTINATDLIFGANLVQTTSTGPGAGFTQRLLTSPDGDIAEDEMVTATGSYSATAPVSPAGAWIMQMVALRTPPTTPLPTVSSVSPNNGIASGGTAVTITGTNFAAGAMVTFGGGAATNVVVVNSTTITATTPAGAGVVTVTVTNPGGQSGSLAGGFTYILPPTVSSASPNVGPLAGGTAVIITGANFASGATVTFGSAAATNVAVVNSTTITATTPAGSAGAVAVTVTNSSGLSGSLASAFTYLAPPTVTSVSPNSGSTAGGTAVTITGTNFAAGATVTFGGAAATNVAVVNSTTITATTPARSAGAVTVTVTVSGQNGSLTSGFTYVVGPTVTSVSPNNGPTAGGTAVTITGANFANGATVTFAGTAATNVVVVNSTTITATTPAGSAGAVTVTVTVNGQSGSLTNGYSYIAPPTVTSVSPNTGTTAGGTAVTIMGTNFATGATVTFGGVAATSVVVVNSTTLTATTPAGSAGAVTVTVTNPGSLIGSLANGYNYTTVPTPTAPTGLTAAGGGPGPIVAAVQSYINSTSLTTHKTASFDSTGGDSIVMLASSHAGVTFTPTDTFGNTWITIAGPTSTSLGFDMRAQIWYARNPIVGPSHTVTMNLSSAQSLVIAIVVLKGTNGFSPIEAISLIGSDNGTGTLNVASPSITTTGTNDLLIGFAKVDPSAVAFTAGPGLTQQPGASSNYLDTETESAATPGTYTATFTVSISETWQAAVVAAANNPNQATLSWTASTETGGTISQYLVERCQGAGCTTFSQIGTTTGTTSNDTGLAPSTSYSYRVRAQDTANTDGPYSNITIFTTPATIPSLPGNLTTTLASSTQINLSWLASAETGGTVNGYLVERCQGSGCSNFAQIGSSAGTSYSDTALVPGSYSYRVRATDTAGNLSPYSNVASGVIADTTPPTAPTNLAASAVSSSQINLSWTASTDNVGVTGYLVERCQGAGCTTFAQIATPTTTTYNDTTVAANASYSYRVRATDAAGNLSQYSNVASATTPSATSTITYVQSNYASPQSSQTSVSVTYTAAQAAGDLNVVVVGWNNSSAAVSVVTDNHGNTYTLAVGPTVQSGVASQSIYYARNIVAAAVGANIVTVTFAGAAAYPDVRILEYSGADLNNPVDVTAASSGSSTTSSSGAVTTTTTTDLIFGANLVRTVTTGPGAGFTRRLLTSPDGDIAEDQMVTAIGSYSATAPVSPSGQWIMQMVAFRTPVAASAPPTVPANVTAIPGSANQINLSWGASVSGVGIANYIVQRCQGAGCTSFAQVAAPTGTTYNDMGLTPNTTYSYRAEAIDNSNILSPFSNVAVATTNALTVSPRTATLTSILTQQFTANGTGVTWSVDGVVGGSSSTGTISASGLYTPPAAAGTHMVTATASSLSANATVYITNNPGTFTHHNDNLRTGQSLSETVLTPANVNQNQFGKLFSYSLDGIAFASPLYVANVSIPGKGAHNVVYVATEHDSVYAFDADGISGSTPLWHVNFLSTGVTLVPCGDTGECGDIPTEIGITGTPVIDPASGTLYLVAKTKEGTNYVQRLHALDITTGGEKFGGPVIIQASVPGSGDGGTTVNFNALRENQRPGLLLSNGIVYLGFGSHGDNGVWHGWILGYNATTLQRVMVYNSTPDSIGGGIWQGGGGLGADANGNLFFTNGNGTFDANTGGRDYGDTIVKLSTSGSVLDYFTPHDQANMANTNIELGSAGPVLLVDLASGPYPHLLITAGKNGTIYVVNRDNMGHYNPNNDSQIVQSLVNALLNSDADHGNYSSPVYFNGYVYFASIDDRLKAFQLTNGQLSTSPTSQSAATYRIRGGSFAISANGNTNGVLWALQNNGIDINNDTGAPGVLFAYDATNLTTELYDTSQAGSRDTLDVAAKFSIPLVVNGKVFVAGQTQLTAYGLLP